MSAEERAEAPERAAFREEVRAFFEANSARREDKSMWAVTFHTDAERQAKAFATGRAWQGTLFRNRLAGLTYPEELGGRGGEAWHESIFREVAADYAAGSGFIASTIAMLGPTLMKWGTDEQKRELVPRLLSGEDAYCQLFSEPGSGSDLAGLATRAVRDGEEFVVTGQKVWNSAAQFCSRGMLLVRTNPDAPKHRGITFLLVDMDSPGIEVRPLVQASGAREFNEVFLSEVRVPVANVLGQIDHGWHVARTVLSNESAFIGGGSGGPSTYDKLVALARRNGFAEDPLVRHGLVTAYVRERVLAMMSERIMAAVRRREAPPVDPSILKLYVADNRALTGNLAMQLGGLAVTAAPGDDEVARWAQAEVLVRFAVSIGGGTNEVQRNNLAERALGLPREPSDGHERPWKDIPRS